MNHKAEEEVEVGNEIDKERHIEQDEKGPLDGRSLTQDGEQKEEHGNRSLDEDCHIRRVPAGVDAGKRRRKVAIKSDHERYAG
jgi:hypothetical protein